MPPGCHAVRTVMTLAAMTERLAWCLLRMIQHGQARRERDNHSSGFRSDNCEELGGVKSTSEVGVNEVDTGILDLHQRQ